MKHVDSFFKRSAKILILGTYSVGKTSLRRRFMGEGFSESYLSTIGVDFSNKQIVTEDSIWNLQFWDIAGQLNYLQITRSFLRACNGIIIVFDHTNISTMNDLINWLRITYEENLSTAANVPVICLGNKIDLIDKEFNSWNANDSLFVLQDFNHLDYYNLSYIPTSAKTGENVNLAFDLLINKIKELQN